MVREKEISECPCLSLFKMGTYSLQFKMVQFTEVLLWLTDGKQAIFKGHLLGIETPASININKVVDKKFYIYLNFSMKTNGHFSLLLCSSEQRHFFFGTDNTNSVDILNTRQQTTVFCHWMNHVNQQHMCYLTSQLSEMSFILVPLNQYQLFGPVSPNSLESKKNDGLLALFAYRLCVEIM